MTLTPENSRFVRLTEMARESSSEKRRELLREVTDVFGDGAEPAAKLARLDQVLSQVVQDFSREVRAELAAKIGPGKAPMGETAHRLALDEIEVARPVLEHSSALSDEQLLAVVTQKTQEHLLAVTRRKEVSEAVSHALVEHGDDRVVVSLLENAQARIGHATYEAVGERAKARPALHAPFVARADVPVELLNDIYLEVEENLRQAILARYETISPAELDAALERSRARLAKAHRRPALETAKARARVEDYRRRGELSAPLLLRLLREGGDSRATFIEAFAILADVDSSVVERAVKSGDLDAVALLSRAAEFPRAVFVSLAIALAGADRRMGRAEEYGAVYENVPVSAAQRAMRFWKVRAASAA